MQMVVNDDIASEGGYGTAVTDGSVCLSEPEWIPDLGRRVSGELAPDAVSLPELVEESKHHRAGSALLSSSEMVSIGDEIQWRDAMAQLRKWHSDPDASQPVLAIALSVLRHLRKSGAGHTRPPTGMYLREGGSLLIERRDGSTRETWNVIEPPEVIYTRMIGLTVDEIVLMRESQDGYWEYE